MHNPLNELPVIKGKWFLDSLLQLRSDPIPFLESQKNQKGIYRVKGPVPIIVVTNHEYIKHVLKDNWRNYEKGPVFKGFSLILGNGILTNEGTSWRTRRKMIQPGFNKDHVQGLADLMRDAVVEFLNEIAPNENVNLVEVKSDMLVLSLKIIARVMMGEELSRAYSTELLPLIEHQCDFVMERNRQILKTPLSIPTPANRKYFQRKRAIETSIKSIIKRKAAETDTTLLSMMQQATDENGRKFTETELIDEFLTLFVTGYETAGSGLAWTLLLLAKHNDVQEKLFSELDGINELSIFELMQCEWLNAIIKESLRLFPPAWIVARQAMEKDEIGGFEIPAKSRILLSIYMTHRDGDFWENPDEFKPERFITNSSPESYLPFGAGPRMCIGNHFGLVEMLVTISTICKKYTLELAEERGYEISAKIALQPKGKVSIRLISR